MRSSKILKVKKKTFLKPLFFEINEPMLIVPYFKTISKKNFAPFTFKVKETFRTVTG
jgi:hypothetical protein